MNINLNVPDRFASFLTDWDYEQYLLIGGYGSGKSYDIALKIILKLLEEKRTCLVCRNVYETLRESCYSLFKEILDTMGILSDHTSSKAKNRDGKVVAVQSPLEIRFPNGSRIIFRGLDNKEKIKSINGVSIVWVEECSEITESVYEELLGRVRVPNVTLHFILSCNPVGRWNWVYQRFFVRRGENGKEITIQDEEEFYRRKTLINKKINKSNGGVYYHHSTASDNPFLQKSYIKRLDEYKETDIDLWRVAKLGRFGANGIRVLPNFEVATNAKDFKNKVNSIPAYYHFFGLDFGFEDSYNALMSCCVDDVNKVLYIYDEIYMNHITDDLFSSRLDVQAVKARAERCEKAICADSAEPKTIQYYRQQGFEMYGCTKYPGSRLQNTKKMKRFKKIICSPKCKNTILELKDLTYAKDNAGNIILDKFNIDPHTLSALWYALDNYTVADLKEQKTNTKAG